MNLLYRQEATNWENLAHVRALLFYFVLCIGIFKVSLTFLRVLELGFFYYKPQKLTLGNISKNAVH